MTTRAHVALLQLECQTSQTASRPATHYGASGELELVFGSCGGLWSVQLRYHKAAAPSIVVPCVAACAAAGRGAPVFLFGLLAPGSCGSGLAAEAFAVACADSSCGVSAGVYLYALSCFLNDRHRQVTPGAELTFV
jgi:hypothetical protein